MLSSFRVLALAVAASLPFVNAYADPGACSGTCTVHDPALIRRTSDGTYFRFSTGNEIQIATAPALIGPWTVEGSALPSGSVIDLAGNTDLWAPDVHYIGGTYYLYYAVSTFGSQDSGIGVATSTTMNVGSWTDHGSVGVSSSSSKPYNAIDPNLITLASGAYQLNFGSFWDDIYEVAMVSPLDKGSNSAVEIAYNPSGTHAEEGAFMYYRSPYYYLFYSAGQCCGLDTSPPASGDEYHIMVCRSESSTSGFVDSNGVSCTNGGGTVVLKSHGEIYAPGGQGVYDDPTYGSVLYYHYFNLDVGDSDADALFGWNTISWSTGWPVV